MNPNKHDWSVMFYGDFCVLCNRRITSGTAKAEHSKVHQQKGECTLIGNGTKENPFQYIPSSNLTKYHKLALDWKSKADILENQLKNEPHHSYQWQMQGRVLAFRECAMELLNHLKQ